METIPETPNAFLNRFTNNKNKFPKIQEFREDNNSFVFDINYYKCSNLLDNFNFMKFGPLIVPRFQLSFKKNIECEKIPNNNIFQKDTIISNLEENNNKETTCENKIKNNNFEGYNINSNCNLENCDEVKEINIQDDNIIKPLIKKKLKK